MTINIWVVDLCTPNFEFLFYQAMFRKIKTFSKTNSVIIQEAR